ncbi:sodium-translocating pyrophosphatase [Spirochaeta lutea]|uniref:Putative K(+)-stimulated pyrophosphate-energized sodium pump n=1 Tax=Spirochaeta lutea TaxID=1480694 RepID=A0A098R2H1_9SPIO|nr:sodium-translocating pyrophosphatase [Spirochaeta lutea]KGE73838.1 potassium transporter [Spirochaeta lutea]
MIGILIVAIVGALSFAAINFYGVKRMDAGTDTMKEIASAIQEGADAFIRHEYKVIFSIAVVIAVVLGILVSWYTGVAFILGAAMSASAGWVGMKIATIANVRVANKARETSSLGQTLKVAFRGGSVMGLSVGGFSLLGLAGVYLVFGELMGQMKPAALQVEANWIGINFIPFTMTVSGYALGCSIIAMFDRVGGGIYTKAADMGADLVGKTEAHIPEDDPRNPATIADNVGDNVGDVAGLGADLLESYVGSLISSVVLAAYMFYTLPSAKRVVSDEFISALIMFPLVFAAIGVIASILGILFLITKKVSDHPHRELNLSVFAAAGLTVIGTGVFTYLYLGDFTAQEVLAMGFNLGFMSPWIAALLGIASGILVGQLAERYTSYDFKPTQNVSAASKEGTALNITEGMATGMKSTFFPVIVLAAAVIGSYLVAGLYGVAMAAIGMLSFVVATVSVDTYGPIADNAGGISEMSKLAPKVREITDELDSVGNTTAAIGKGFAIGSASLAALSLFASFLYSQVTPEEFDGFTLMLNMIDPLILAGALVGAALPYLFSGILIEAVANAARKMVQEVRRQFKADPKILTGESKPDYRLCIEISSAGALREMKLPAVISVLTPILSGFLFGPTFVGGLLIGTTLSAILLALYTANAGGSWDNAKKYIEQGHHGGKGSEAHSAAVIGDTVGDPLKDTVGPSLDILIKIMSVVSIIMVSIYQKYNLFDLFK